MALIFPSITWSGGTHLWVAGTPVDNPRSSPHLEAEVYRVPATGEQDSWVDGIYQRAEFDLRWVPIDGTATDAGWNTPTPGLRAFEAHQKQNKDNFTFKPDKDGSGHTCRLIRFDAQKEVSGLHYRVKMVIEDVSGSPFTEY